MTQSCVESMGPVPWHMPGATECIICYTIFLAGGGGPAFKFSTADLEGYCEQPEFLDLVATLKGPQLARAKKVQALVPL